jgi:hypothetical protein
MRDKNQQWDSDLDNESYEACGYVNLVNVINTEDYEEWLVYSGVTVNVTQSDKYLQNVTSGNSCHMNLILNNSGCSLFRLDTFRSQAPGISCHIRLYIFDIFLSVTHQCIKN